MNCHSNHLPHLNTTDTDTIVHVRRGLLSFFKSEIPPLLQHTFSTNSLLSHTKTGTTQTHVASHTHISTPVILSILWDADCREQLASSHELIPPFLPSTRMCFQQVSTIVSSETFSLKLDVIHKQHRNHRINPSTFFSFPVTAQ